MDSSVRLSLSLSLVVFWSVCEERGVGYSRNEDVYFMGPDRKSIHCNVYHSVIISPPNGRTIIQSFRSALPEALSQLFLNSKVSNVAMIERRVSLHT